MTEHEPEEKREGGEVTEQEPVRNRGMANLGSIGGIASDASDPSREEIGKSPHVIIILCGAAFIAFGVWASISTLDIVSMTIGEVIPSTQVKTVQHLEGGILRKIMIREGDQVKSGQPLVVL